MSRIDRIWRVAHPLLLVTAFSMWLIAGSLLWYWTILCIASLVQSLMLLKSHRKLLAENLDLLKKLGQAYQQNLQLMDTIERMEYLKAKDELEWRTELSGPEN